MNPASFVCFVLILTFLPNKIISDSSDLITKTCDATLYKDLCNSILQSDPASKQADLTGLAKIVLNMASSNASNIQNHITQMTKTSSNDDQFQGCLKVCSDTYQAAIDAIEESKPALDDKRYYDALTELSAVITNANTCEDCFTEQPGQESPISDMSNVFNQICSIQLAIAKILSGN